MDQFTTIIVLREKQKTYEKVLSKYKTMFEDMIVDPRVNNALKGYYRDQIEEIDSKLNELDEFEKEVEEKGLYESKLGKKLINKANNISG